MAGDDVYKPFWFYTPLYSNTGRVSCMDWYEPKKYQMAGLIWSNGPNNFGVLGLKNEDENTESIKDWWQMKKFTSDHTIPSTITACRFSSTERSKNNQPTIVTLIDRGASSSYVIYFINPKDASTGLMKTIKQVSSILRFYVNTP